MIKILKDEVIGLDRGHGVKYDGGAVGIVKEEKVIDEVCDRFIEIAKSRGYKVVELRPSSATSTSNSLSQRTDKANNSEVDFYLSIHGNAYDGSANGTEAFVYKLGGKAETLAKQIVNSICDKIGTYNRGVKANSELFVLRKSSMAAALIELLFIDSQKDINLYNPSKIAESIANSILEESSSYNAEVVNVTSYLNVRETPGGSIVGKLNPGQKVNILEEKKFYKVAYQENGNMVEGFVSAEYIRRS